MIDKNQLKTRGLDFGRALQRAYKIALLYTAEHSGSEAPIQQAFLSLENMLKLSPQFTFGFYNQRVLLNDLLTADTSVAPLQAEFSKRRIAAASFFSGISVREFRRGISILATKPDVIEQAGGIELFLKKNPIEGMRILADEKKPDKDEDSVLGMDLQSYLVAQSVLDPLGGSLGSGLDSLLSSSGLQRPQSFGGSPGEIMALASQAAQTAWGDPAVNPLDPVKSLTRLLEEFTPDFLFPAMSSAQQTRYRGLPTNEIATELSEDIAIQWAGNRLTETFQATGSTETVEPSVVRVLGRSLRATQVAQRFLRKLGKLAEEGKLPPEIIERVKQDLLWSGMSLEDQHKQILATNQFTDREFRHLLEYIEETGKGGNIESATEAAGHFLEVTLTGELQYRLVGLNRVPILSDLFDALHALSFARLVASRLSKELQNEAGHDDEIHQAIAGVLSRTARSASMYEDFSSCLKIGAYLQDVHQKDPPSHMECCHPALENLVSPSAAERLIEIVMQKHIDTQQGRVVASLLRLGGTASAEAVLKRLEQETEATARTKLLRIAGQLGPSAFAAVRTRLNDERWFVVRNACNILNALNDPDIATALETTLNHSDPRVQQAAVVAIIRSKDPKRGEVLARCLPKLPPQSQEAVLNEMIVMKDQATIAPIEEFLLSTTSTKGGICDLAAMVLCSIGTDFAIDKLARILRDTTRSPAMRKSVFQVLMKSTNPLAQNRLTELAALLPKDSLFDAIRKSSGKKT